MDQARFDDLTRALGGILSRRGLVRSLAATGLGFGAARTPLPAAARCAKPGQTCKTKRGKQRCCGDAKCQGKRCRCPAEREPCGGTCCAKGSTCDEGTCVPCDVCRSGCAFPTVQVAINAAESGDTIRLCPTTYGEVITIAAKELTLLGAGAGRTVLAGGGGPGAGTVVVVAADATVELRNLTVTGGHGTSGGGIFNAGSLVLDGVSVVGNKANFGAGIAQLGGGLTLRNSRVSGNEAFVSGGGLYIDDGLVRLESSRVTGNEAASLGGGLYVQAGPVTLEDTPVTGNNAASGGGVYLAGTATIAMTIEPGSVTGNTPDNCAGQPLANCAN